MFNKVVSIIMSAAIAFTGLLNSSLNEIIDAVVETVFGIPYTALSIEADFFNEIDDGDIELIDGGSAYVKDKIAVFIEEKTAFFKKAAFFKSCGGTLAGWSAPANLYVIRYPSMTYEEALGKCAALSENDAVALAVPVFAFRARTDLTPNDPFDLSEDSAVVWDEKNPEGKNWHLEAVCARQAWDYSDYFGEINVGVVDAGVDPKHSDLEGRIFFPDKKQESRNRPDAHGNHVAGIIAGKQNNGIGTAGVCDKARLLCVDWSPDFLQIWSTELSIFFSLSLLVKAGAKVVNYSLGISGSRENDAFSLVDDLLNPMALSYAMSSLLANGYDFIAVQSAGNGDASGKPVNSERNGHFAAINERNIFTGVNGAAPSEILDRIIVAGSSSAGSGRNFRQSAFSNVGLGVDVTAPGENVYSCVLKDGYDLMSGTSMAAPVATGVAALVWSVNPRFSGAQVKEIVCSSYAETVPPNDPDSPYDDDARLTSYPMVNAMLAVEEAVRRSYPDMGTASGVVDGDAADVLYDGVKHAVFSDGTFRFVAKAGSGTALALSSDGSVISSFELEVKKDADENAADEIS